MKTNLNIVIADDDIDDQVFIQSAIAEINPNHTYVSVYNGIQLLDLLLKRGRYKELGKIKPDFIILDVHMPIMGGDKILAEMKSQPNLANIPVFIFSEKSSHPETRYSQFDVAGYYSKPVLMKDFKKIIIEMIEKYKVKAQKGRDFR